MTRSEKGQNRARRGPREGEMGRDAIRERAKRSVARGSNTLKVANDRVAQLNPKERSVTKGIGQIIEVYPAYQSAAPPDEGEGGKL